MASTTAVSPAIQLVRDGAIYCLIAYVLVAVATGLAIFSYFNVIASLLYPGALPTTWHVHHSTTSFYAMAVATGLMAAATFFSVAGIWYVRRGFRLLGYGTAAGLVICALAAEAVAGSLLTVLFGLAPWLLPRFSSLAELVEALGIVLMIGLLVEILFLAGSVGLFLGFWRLGNELNNGILKASAILMLISGLLAIVPRTYALPWFLGLLAWILVAASVKGS